MSVAIEDASFRMDKAQASHKLNYYLLLKPANTYIRPGELSDLTPREGMYKHNLGDTP